MDVHGTMPEVDSGKLVSYDDVLGVANEVVLWKNLDAETQRKIRVLVKKIQSEEMSEWHSYDED